MDAAEWPNGRPPSNFQRALQKYIADLPEKKKKRKFIVTCCASPTPVTPESINEAIKQAEEKNAQRPGIRMLRKILSPVIEALRNYQDIIDTFDPFPTALLWGSLKVILDGSHRFFSLFDTIKKELRSLTSQLQRINDYEHLYGDSEVLQEMFCNSYINMLRFWNRVDKECDTCWYTGMLKAATTFSTKKLNDIIRDIEEDADQIEKYATILEAAEGKTERQAAELERLHASTERAAAQKERDAQGAWREQNQEDRQEERYHKITEWLCARQGNEDNMRQLRVHTSSHLHGTCEWLFRHRAYLDWHEGTITPAVLWVYGPPAAGKSILSTHLIDVLKETASDEVVVYHFWRFDQTHTASETLRLLASQLFDAYWARQHSVSEDMYSKAQQNVCSLENVQELITLVVQHLPKVYFILDGLDEECMGNRWQETTGTLDFLVKLASDEATRVRVWYSSQPRPCISERLKAYGVLDIQDVVKDDVAFYLSRGNPEIGDLEISDHDKDAVLKSLQARAESNFLWASLMLKSLKETTSLNDMNQFIKEGLPETLDDYYRKIFERFEKPQRTLVSKIFALVAFARRPLRLGEVREAVGLLLSKNPRSLDVADMPFISRIRTLLPPLIVLQQDDYLDADDCTCRLFHSTVRDFLFRNPAVFQSGMGDNAAGDVLVTPDAIGDACLLYLSQDRYGRLLRKRENRWVDTSGESVDRHHFHLYAAKYWDKHLDDCAPSESLHNRIGAFITSPNFQTCIQVQGLWIDGQFGVFCYPARNDNKVYLRRMFPAWFVGATPATRALWADFRSFVHEWRYFIHCPRFDDPTSPTLPYSGELDRCWWSALGSHNFLSKFKCKYTTFTFQKDGQGHQAGGHYIESVSADGKDLATIALTSRGNGSLEFTCEQWTATGNSMPTLRQAQIITTTDTETSWRSYVKPLIDGHPQRRIGRAHPIAFTASNDFLRIGAQIFQREDDGKYIPIPGLSAAIESHPAYFEEFAVRGNIVAVASRRESTPESRFCSGLPDEMVNYLGFDFLKIEGVSRHGVEKRVEEDSDSDGSESSTDSEDAGYETWSEGSTELSESYEDDFITPWAGPMSDIDETDSDDLDSDTDSSESSEDDSLEDSQTSESESEESDVDPSAVTGYGRWHEDDSDLSWSDSDIESDTSSQSKSNSQETINADISIFDTNHTDLPKRIFHFTKTLPFLLYDSPPAIHPSKSLVIWPLGAGDVLFADFIAKTYFVRKLRPSTLYTRHIFMKCRFSPCGSYAHFACLEGQKKPNSRERTEEQPVKIALLVSTYRLSSRKTSRSPPSLIHRVRMKLGFATKLPVPSLPFTMTWTPTELYFTTSDKILHVNRIPLFNVDKTSSTREHPVLIPRKPLFLPESASRREVYFFPSPGDNGMAKVIIGGETRAVATQVVRVDDQLPGKQSNRAMFAMKVTVGHRVPPIGCYLREETDLGGWGKCRDFSKLPEDLGIAQLDRRLEKFDPEEDCDLELYIS